jgi:hypothetical protein
MAGPAGLLRFACLVACLAAAQGSRGMCTYIMLDRSGGRWRIPDRCTHLYLTQVQFGAPGARQMAELLRSNPGVTEVDASSCGIKGLTGAAALGDALRNNTLLRRLNLGNNRLGDAGAESIAAGLAVNTGLRSLNLAHNRVGPHGAAALARALQANRVLTSLDLDLNRLHDEGAVQLAPALRDNDVLSTLVLSGNMIGNVGAAALADALAVNRGLTRLHLKYNRISGEGARLLAEAALQNGRVAVTGPEFLMHTMQRMQLKRKALAEPRNATLLLEVATLYDAGRLSAHKVLERYSQAYCWCAPALVLMQSWPLTRVPAGTAWRRSTLPQPQSPRRAWRRSPQGGRFSGRHATAPASHWPPRCAPRRCRSSRGSSPHTWSETSAGCVARWAARTTPRTSCNVASRVSPLALLVRSDSTSRPARGGAERKPAETGRHCCMQRRHHSAGRRWRTPAVHVHAKRKGVVALLCYLVKVSFPTQSLEALPRVEGQRRVVIGDDVQVEQAAVVDRLRVFRVSQGQPVSCAQSERVACDVPRTPKALA